jgi:hypothetical protein
MVEARRCLDNRKGDSPLAFDDLIDLYEAKLNLLRAIRAAMSLAPDKGRCFADSLPELKEKLTTDGFRRLCEQVMCEHVTSVGGNRQYNVPNFTIMNRHTNESADATSPSSPTFQSLLKLAYEERLANIRAMMKCIQDLFFEEVYVPGKKYDMFYYRPNESMDETEFYAYVIEKGFATTRAEAEAKFPDTNNITDKDLLKCFADDTIAHYRDSHHTGFWTFQERHSICHGFSG